MDRQRKIRVLVVDDSAVMRKVISTILDRDAEIEVVATAIDGDFAINKAMQLKPDVVTLDVDMPRMDGITALRHIVSKQRAPVLMFSSLTTRDAALTLKALEIGAVDFICKPRNSAMMESMAEELVAKVKAAARSRVLPPLDTAPLTLREKKKHPHAPRLMEPERLVAIGASTGGPHALRSILPRLPASFEAGIVIVQHMPASFTSVMASWLDEICQIDVREARDHDMIAPGLALIAPGDSHLTVKRTPFGGTVHLSKGGLVNGHMPSVDVLFRSVAKEYGPRAAGLIMTGMGSDGAEGLGEIKRAGGFTVAQDKDSCAIFGMPRTAIERGYVDAVAALSDLPARLIAMAGKPKNMEVLRNGKLS
ncbi:MAG TPA: chemotaxis response regulator protein-glutamate methylesterase [Blastocatellia bacterium]|nr:chemotaxis response regulator protein-glutamate methylesterase [Blastocatellia bacterium]